MRGHNAIIKEDIVRLPIKFKNLLKTIILDLEIFEELEQCNFFLEENKNGDLRVFFRYKWNDSGIILHRYIMKVTDPDILVDHKNKDTLDNRRENLRTCDKSQNAANSGPRSGKYKGVYYRKDTNKWIAQFTYLGKTKHLGSFNSVENAARAYDKAAFEQHGKFAYLNFPKKG